MKISVTLSLLIALISFNNLSASSRKKVHAMLVDSLEKCQELNKTGMLQEKDLDACAAKLASLNWLYNIYYDEKSKIYSYYSDGIIAGGLKKDDLMKKTADIPDIDESNRWF